MENDSTERTGVPTRTDVLAGLWDSAKWLMQKRKQQRLKVTPVLKTRIWLVNSYTSACKTLLSGLKDEELELRVKALEDKLKSAVLIPDGSEQKNTSVRR